MSVPKVEAGELSYVPNVELGEQRVKSTILAAYRQLHQMSRSRLRCISHNAVGDRDSQSE